MDGIVRMRTIAFTPDRTPTLRRIRLGYEGDNLVERLEFDLPEIVAGQTATLMITGADAVTLDRTDEGRYAVDLTREMIGPDGEREAYVRIDGAGGEVWQSAPMRMTTGALPDVEEEIEKVYPTAVGQMLTAMAEHSGEMQAQEERVEQAAQRAEEAAERAEAGGGGGGSGGSTVEIDATLTQAGKAADAKATGDRLSELSKEIADYPVYTTPQAFGAVGDGETDDTAAFLAAIESGKAVYVPYATYKLGLFEINTECRIFGDVHKRPQIKCDGFAVKKRSFISGLFLSANTSREGTGILISASGCEVADCDVYSFNIGMDFAQVHNVDGAFRRLTFAYNYYAGVNVDAGGDYQKNTILFDNLYIVNNGVATQDPNVEASELAYGFGMRIDGGLAIEIRNCTFEYNSGVGLYLDHNYPLYGCVVSSPYFEYNKYANLYINNIRSPMMKVHISGEYYTDADRALPSNAHPERKMYLANNSLNGVVWYESFFSHYTLRAASGYYNRYCRDNLFPFDIIGEIENNNITMSEVNGERVWTIPPKTGQTLHGVRVYLESGRYVFEWESMNDTGSASATGAKSIALINHPDGTKSSAVWNKGTEWTKQKLEFEITQNGDAVVNASTGSTEETLYLRNIRVRKISADTTTATE